MNQLWLMSGHVLALSSLSLMVACMVEGTMYRCGNFAYSSPM